jgi:hypothetical protein
MPDDNAFPAGGVDPNVRVPKAVAAAAARSQQIIEQLQTPPAQDPPAAPAGDPPAEPGVTAAVTTPPAAPEPPKEPAQTPPAAAAPEPPKQPVTPPAADDDDNSQTWKHRYHAMKGRFDQSILTINQMQDQLRLMGDEMVRLQEFVKNNGSVAVTPQGQTVPKLLTPEDRQTYGDELLDVVQRAATEAVLPKITAVEQENRDLKQQVQRQRQSDMNRTLDLEVPQWRVINKHPRFKAWCSLTDLLAGSVRGQLLNNAVKAADAPRVVAFFKAFLADEAATGSTEFAPTVSPQPPAPAPAPRTPAVALEALAAPGRAKPAAADTGKPADKPVFTRAQIARFYDDCRKQVFAGREQERAALEAAIFSAQNEGRVRG